jgi:hypothetical protein
MTSALALATDSRHLDIEFLFLELDSCGRCTSTDRTLGAALEIVTPALRAMGVTVSLTKELIHDENQARRLGFVASPTIRINGHDIAAELIESQCDACTDACGCGGSIACRDWLYEGERHTEPPLGLIVEAIMTHASRPSAVEEPARHPHDVPPNLRRFFAAKSGPDPACPTGCCSPGDQATCYEPAAKDDCCGPQTASTAECGCR